MSYTPTTWATGDTITAAKLNNMEDGIANAGGGWDAIIRLTHADNSGPDNYTNLTPSIVEGTFADLTAKLQDGGCPCILVQYCHPWGERWAVPMVHGLSWDASTLHMTIVGYLPFSMNSVVLNLNWSFNDTVAWVD